MPVGVPLVLVDAFSSTGFAGNPAAVCLLEAATEEHAWMQRVAAELNQPATAFLFPAGDGFRLRWFTATAELELCGHGTLASAHVLWEEGRLAAEAPARFETRGGSLAATRAGRTITLALGAEPARALGAADEPVGNAVVAALGVTPRFVGKNRLDYLVEVEDERTVREVTPDLRALAGLPTRGAMVTAPSADGRYDFVSRFFAPRVGLDEDAVTGSAHCCLGPYWARRLGRTELAGRQLSARGGTVTVRVADDRVLLGGEAVTVLRGTLLV